MSIKDSAASIKDSATSIKDSAVSIKDSAASIEDSATSIKDSATSIKDSTMSIKDSMASVKDSMAKFSALSGCLFASTLALGACGPGGGARSPTSAFTLRDRRDAGIRSRRSERGCFRKLLSVGVFLFKLEIVTAFSDLPPYSEP